VKGSTSALILNAARYEAIEPISVQSFNSFSTGFQQQPKTERSHQQQPWHEAGNSMREVRKNLQLDEESSNAHDLSSPAESQVQLLSEGSGKPEGFHTISTKFLSSSFSTSRKICGNTRNPFI
jgi:hypothetical protein